MRQQKFVFAIFLLGTVPVLPGCYSTAGFGKAPWKKTTPTVAVQPTIDAEWSEPVNGVRLAVTQITGNTPDDHVLLLVMAHNTTDQPVDWPAIRADPTVRIRQPDGTDASAGYASHTNLRIVVESLDGRARDVRGALAWERLAELHRLLEPGEIRLHAIRLEDDQAQQYQRLKRQRNTIDVEPVLWPGMSSHDTEGRWLIHLIYRPEGFPPPLGDGRLTGRAEPDISEQWKGVEINVPAIEIDWVPIPGPNDL
ncbi:MAG: hypothetical protein ACE37H_01580 [Phycisphaeraceae bacterium]